MHLIQFFHISAMILNVRKQSDRPTSTPRDCFVATILFFTMNT